MKQTYHFKIQSIGVINT